MDDIFIYKVDDVNDKVIIFSQLFLSMLEYTLNTFRSQTFPLTLGKIFLSCLNNFELFYPFRFHEREMK